MCTKIRAEKPSSEEGVFVARALALCQYIQIYSRNHAKLSKAGEPHVTCCTEQKLLTEMNDGICRNAEFAQDLTRRVLLCIALHGGKVSSIGMLLLHGNIGNNATGSVLPSH